MGDPLLIKSLRDFRGQILGWGLGIGALLLLTTALYPSVSSIYGEMMDQLPEGFLSFFGAEVSLDTLEGYLSMEFFSYAHMALAVFAILAGTSVIAGEESQGTLELLLAEPVTRLRLGTMKLVALATATAAVMLVVLACFWVGVLTAGVETASIRITVAMALMWLFLLTIAYLSALFSLALPGRLFAGTAMAVLVVASYILESLARMVTGLEPFRPLMVTTYYRGQEALTGQVSWGHVAGLVGILVVAFLLTLVLFQRRDIGVGTRRLPRLLPRLSRPNFKF
jgi:ABC-2 type transport system permease protein